MSAEDLERYETEIELQLYKEYRDVLPMFAYVVETERRFYLANAVKLDVTHRGRPDLYFELELQRRVGLGHVPPGALRRQRAGRDVQGRQHRGARQGRLSVADRRRRALGAAGEDAVAALVRERRATRCSTATGAAARASSTSSSRAAGVLVFCEVKTRRGTAFGAPVEAVTRHEAAADPHAGACAGSTSTPIARRASCASTSRRCWPRAGTAPVIDVIEAAF